MQIIIFVLVLIALIVVHEFGHFVAAKLSGMRVDEFGLGYPPRAYTMATIGETKYTLNWIPFGGFVKIFGEDGSSEVRDPRAFSSRPRILQAVVLLAGITMNLLFAYLLITGALIAGTPRVLQEGELAVAENVQLAVAGVLPDSPAAQAGLLPGDIIKTAVHKFESWKETDPESFTTFIRESEGDALTLTIDRNGSAVTLTATPVRKLVASNPNAYALGVEVFTVGVVPLSFGAALVEGASLTWSAIKLTAMGLVGFFSAIFTFTADFSQVTGPVGIAGVVGNASAEGIGSLFSIMAIISINLALINLIPVPALDGGRFLFVLIESVTRRPIKSSTANIVNSIGFVFLLALMVVVTAHDIFKMVG